MPTQNPRVNVTLSPSLDDLVRRLAVHQRVSKAEVLRELLEVAEPALRRACRLMEAAVTAPAALRAAMASAMELSQDKAEERLAQVLGMDGSGLVDLVSAAESVRGRRPRRGRLGAHGAGGGGASNPPASNRGVKSGTTVQKTGVHSTGGQRRKAVKS